MPQGGGSKNALSLRKSRAPLGDWRKFGKGKGMKQSNPYADFQMLGPKDNNIPPVPNYDKQKIKRRLSMKVDGMPGPDLGSMPSLPQGAMELIQKQEIDSNVPRPDPGQLKPRAKPANVLAPLADENFNAHSFVTNRLHHADATEVDEFTTKLVEFDEKIDGDIKNNVNKSYEKILIVSNDLSSTKLELKSLKTAVITLQEITGQMKELAEVRLQMELGTNGSSKSLPSINARGTRDRSSVMILEKRWVEEMNSLFKHVEGAQKYLSAIPTRHIVAESGRWFELNAATWKHLQPCHLFVLNDHLLIAANKKGRHRQGSGALRLVADHCWPIRDIQLVEINDNVSKGNNYFTLNFKYHGSSYIYQTDTQDQYSKIVRAFRKAQTQLRDLTNQETLKQRKLRDSMSIISASDKSGKRNSNILQDLSARMHTRSRSIDNMDIMRNLRDIDDTIDEVDINVAHQKFREAVELIKVCELQISQKKDELLARNSDSKSSEEVLILLDVLQMKLDQRKNQLENALVFEINDELNTTNDISDFIFFLKTLNLVAIAKENLLISRSKLVTRLIKEVEFEGNLPDYITQVSIIRFQSIKATTLLYKESFPEGEYASDLIKWATEEIKNHAVLLTKQLMDVKVDSPIYKKCIEITQVQAAELKKVGLNIDYLLAPVYSK